MENQIIIYGKDSAGTITPITLQGTGQNTTINYLESIETADDRGTSPGTRVMNEQFWYNSSTSKWDSRLGSMYSYLRFGTQAAWAGPGERNLLQNANWNTITSTQTTNIPVGTFTYNTTTGVISGLTSTSYYRIDAHLSLNGFNISATTVWTLKIYDQDGITLRSTQITQISDSTCPSLHIIYMSNGITSIRPTIGLTAGTYGQIGSDISITLSIQEI